MSLTRYVVLLLLAVGGCSGGGTQELVPPDTRVMVETLASDAFEGRLTGTEGIRRAADYIVEQLGMIGARPLPGQPDFRLPFQFTAGVSDGGDHADRWRELWTTALGW